MERGYPQNLIENLLPEIKFREGESKLKTNNKKEKEILPFATQYQPSVSSRKEAWMKNWNLIQLAKEPPIISLQERKIIEVHAF